jgi:hypothetical protein
MPQGIGESPDGRAAHRAYWGTALLHGRQLSPTRRCWHWGTRGERCRCCHACRAGAGRALRACLQHPPATIRQRCAKRDNTQRHASRTREDFLSVLLLMSTGLSYLTSDWLGGIIADGGRDNANRKIREKERGKWMKERSGC